MPFIITAHDYPDALSRRKETREAHLSALAGLKAAGKVLYAAALLNDQGDMTGSMLVVDFADRAAVDEYLQAEPYVLNQVWEKIIVVSCRPAPV